MVVWLRDGQPVGPERPPMPGPRRSWMAWLGVVVLIACGLVWLLKHRLSPIAPTDSRPPAVAMAAVAAQAPAVPGLGSVAQVAGPPAEPQAVEICGAGRYTRAQLEADEDLLRRTLERPRQQALASTLASMQDHAEPRTRAAFMAMTYLEALQAVERDASAAAKDACAVGPCGGLPPEASAVRDRLLGMTATSNDPFVVQMGLMTCGALRADARAACLRPLIARWIEIEPRNAVPWMHLASMAQEAKDGPMLAQAMRAIAAAEVVDERHGLFTHELTRHIDATAEPLLALSLLLHGQGVEAARVWPIQPVNRHCEARALSDGARRSDCERIAMLLTEQSRQLLDYAIGISIGKRLGWSADRVERLEVRKDAVIQASMARAGEGQDFTSCRALATQRALLLDTVELGEMGAELKRMAAAGQSEAEMAARHREAMRRLVETSAGSRPAEAASR